jgi:hypothetical protein
MPPAELIDGGNLVGASVDGRICVFSKTERLLDGGEFKAGGKGRFEFLLVDLVPEQAFEVTRDGAVVYAGSSSANTLLSFRLELDGACRIGFRKAAGRTGAGRQQQ